MAKRQNAAADGAQALLARAVEVLQSVLRERGAA